MPSIKLPPHVVRYVRRGRDFYYWQPGRNTPGAAKAVRLLDDPRDPAWWDHYREVAGIQPRQVRHDTLVELSSAWLASPAVSQLADASQRQYRRHARLWPDLLAPLKVVGVRDITRPVVTTLRDALADTPSEANAHLRSLSSFLSWCVDKGHVSENVAKGAKKLRTSGTWEPWSDEALAIAEQALPPHLWWPCALALYTGQREGDVLSMAWSHIRDGRIRVKGEKDGGVRWIPIHRDLAPVLDALPRSATTLLTNTRGQPWTKDGFRASLAKAKPPLLREERCVFHGLRKNAVNALLEVGCTVAETAAITGQTLQMVELYAARVNQVRLADAAMLKWEAGRCSN